MVIYLDAYRKAKAAKQAARSRYYEERLIANCMGFVGMSSCQTTRELTPELPEDFSKIDTKAFLDRVCALATQV